MTPAVPAHTAARLPLLKARAVTVLQLVESFSLPWRTRREDVMAGKLKRTRRVPVATLGVKDFCGEDTVAGQSATHTHSVVAVTDVSVFQIEQKVLQK